MRRLLAFAIGVIAVLGGRAAYPGPPDDPFPGPSEVRELILRLGREAPPRQVAAFADNRIDASEYHTAVSSRIACLSRRAGPGIDIAGPAPLAGGRLITWHYRVPEGAADAATDFDRACASEHSDSIERAWKLTMVPQGESRRREVGKFVACLRGLGMTLDGGIRSVLAAAVDAEVPVGRCVDDHAVLFDL